MNGTSSVRYKGVISGRISRAFEFYFITVIFAWIMWKLLLCIYIDYFYVS